MTFGFGFCSVLLGVNLGLVPVLAHILLSGLGLIRFVAKTGSGSVRSW